MRKLTLTALAGLAMAAFVPSARASTVPIIEPDPLHGACTGCTHTTIGGNDVTVLGPLGVSSFGFTSSPPGASGNFQLKVLIPDVFTLAQVQAFDQAVNVTNNGNIYDLHLYSATPWTSGFLETDYLNNDLAPGAPKNPLDAWIGATNFVRPGPDSSGYYLLTAETGAHTFGGQGDAVSLANTFGLSPALMALGGLIVGNMFTDSGVISTAQSSALFFNAPSGGPFSEDPPGAVPIPGMALAVPLGAFGLAWVARRRRNELAA